MTESKAPGSTHSKDRPVSKRSMSRIFDVIVAGSGAGSLSESFDEGEGESSARPLPMGSIRGLSGRLMEEARNLGYEARDEWRCFMDKADRVRNAGVAATNYDEGGARK